MRPFKLRVFVSLVLLLIYTATVILNPLIPGLAINAINSQLTNHTQQYNSLYLICVVFMVNNVASWLAQYQQVFQMTWVGQHAFYGVSRDMFRHISKLSLGFFDPNETGRVMARMQNDVTVLQATLSSGFISILGSLLSLAGIFVTLLLLNWKLALMVFLTVPLMGICFWFWQRWSRPSFLAARCDLIG